MPNYLLVKNQTSMAIFYWVKKQKTEKSIFFPKKKILSQIFCIKGCTEILHITRGFSLDTPKHVCQILDLHIWWLRSGDFLKFHVDQPCAHID